MLDYKDILNKHYVLRLSAREISRQIGVSKSGILKFLQAFEKCKDLDYDYSGAAKPPVRQIGNHLSGIAETICRNHVRRSRQHSPEGLCQL